MSEKSKKRGRRKAEMRFFSNFVLLTLSLAVAALGALYWENRNFMAPGPAPQQTLILIEPGAGLKQIARQLDDAGVVEHAEVFRFGVARRNEAGNIKAGEYAFPAHASMADVLEMLVQGRSVLRRLTIPEGLTSAMAMELLNAAQALSGGVAAVPPEGSLLPETYLFQRGDARQRLIARMRKAQADLLAKLWPARKPGLPFQTIQEAIILASIVEKETSIPAERPRIAAIFVNRLRKGIKLESDPTIIYGLTKGYPLGHGLRQSEIAEPNPYSTYQIAGLPPTPICNPGRDAIAAVLNPPDSLELYFVADGNGGHAFAETWGEHLKNVANLRKIEQERSGVR
ncbi:MAG: endolytic transglycosylase MltG [Alphaproteobacteria bacterium]